MTAQDEDCEDCDFCGKDCICTVSYLEYIDIKKSHEALLKASKDIIDYVDPFDAEGSRRLSSLISAISVAESK